MPEGKYLIHARVRTDGVVERNDVVGAVFGQTEGLLGDELDLRHLQQSAKVGRIDVTLSAEDGRSTGEITIATGLDRVETAVLAAALETIDQVGPCRAEIEVTEIEDLREAKRRSIVERAEQLLAEFEADALTSEELVAAVRKRARVQAITTYEGLPAGPRVADSDAVIVVEGRADVLQLLEFGVKNAIAVEGTDVPDVVARLSRDRTVTAFFDGDRGGELLGRELDQVADVDYVAFAPDGQSVEDLTRAQALEALRRKVPVEHLEDAPDATPSADPANESAPAGPDDGTDSTAHGGDEQTASGTDAAAAETGTDEGAPEPIPDGAVPDPESANGAATASGPGPETDTADSPPAGEPGDSREPASTLADHVAAVIGEETGTARLLDETFESIAEGPADEAGDLVADAPADAHTLVLDGRLSQATLDVAAQLGVGQIVAREEGEYVKQPTSVRVRTAAEF